MGYLLQGRPPYVGRKAELDVLEAQLLRARRGHLRFVLLEGEPGIGKSRLASHFLSRKRAIIGLSACGSPFGTDAPFGLWAEALEGHLRNLPDDDVRSLCGGSLDDLSPILRSAAAARGAESMPPSTPRVREALAVLLGNLAAKSPLVVLLDDLHLADTSSWDALDYMVRSLSGSPILVVGCARPGELASRTMARRVLFRLEQDGILHRMDLPPLDVDDLWVLSGRLLSRRTAPRALAEWLFARSRGNPLFAVGLLDALVQEGGDLTEPGLVSLPESLSDRVVSQLDELAEDQHELLEYLAVFARTTGLDELARTTGQEIDELARIAGSLVRMRLVVEREWAQVVEYEMSHPLIQEAVYEAMGPARRRILHRDVARALRDAGRVADAAAHFVRAAHVGDPETIDALVTAAGRAWTSGAFTEALELARPLLDLMPRGEQGWIRLLDELRLDERWLYHHRTEVDYELGVALMRAVDRALDGSGDAARSAVVNFNLATFLAWGSGDRGEARRRAETAIELFARAKDDQRTRMSVNELAWILGLSGDFEAQEDLARRTLEDAKTANDPGATVMALHSVASTLWPRGRFAEAEDAWRRDIEIARTEGNLARIAEAHAILALSLAYEGKLTEGRRSLRNAAAVGAESADALIIEMTAHLAWFSGEIDATVTAAREALERFGPQQTTALQLGATAAAESGDIAGARRLIAEAQATVAGRAYWIIEPFFRWAKGVIAWREHDAGRSLDDLEDATSSLRAIGALAPEADMLVDLAEAAAEAGRPEITAGAAARLAAISDTIGRDRYRALAAIGAAWAHLAAGDGPNAVDRARDAADLLSEHGYRLLEGRALSVLGLALRLSDRPAAVEALTRAIDLLKACGAEVRRNRAHEALRRLGTRGRRAAAGAAGPGSLTRREHEVVSLAAEGLTAAQIGDRLFIGRRTVETHLSNAYAKLGVRSRIELMKRVSDFRDGEARSLR